MVIAYSQRHVSVELESQNLCIDDWNMTFEDEFEGYQLDETKWFTYYPYGPNRSDQCEFCRTHGNEEGQIYKDENVRVENGFLYLDLKRESSTWYTAERNYTSGMINSIPRFTNYGKFEIRCKVTEQQGLWPAFWMFGWSTEIDVFEFLQDSNNEYEISVHFWDAEGNRNSGYNEIHDAGQDLSNNMHTYLVEYTPTFTKFYLDGTLVEEYYKYKKPNGTPVKDCNIQKGTYQEDLWYPKFGNSLDVIANVAVENAWSVPNLLSNESMQIDYIRVYENTIPCSDFEPIVEIDRFQTEIWTSDRKVQTIRVRENATLEISNAMINFVNDGSLILDNGATLILDGATLTSCTEQGRWKGIHSNRDATIEMKEGSLIENAFKGIRVGNKKFFNSTNQLSIESNSGFRNCITGIQIDHDNTISTIVGRSWFEGCHVGISLNQSSGLIIDETDFINNNTAIKTLDSFLNFRDDNTIHGGNTGIRIEGTFPGVSDVSIGDAGKGSNSITTNNLALFVMEQSHRLESLSSIHPLKTCL